jgi:hypothetical protein
MIIASEFIERTIPMVTYSKLIPVIALAAALAPFTAYARSDMSPPTDAAHSQILEGQFSDQTAPGGRGASANVPAGLSLHDAAAVYAAIGTIPVEN